MGYYNLSCRTEASVLTCQSSAKSVEATKLRVFRHKELEAATGGFAVESLLGKGSYGWVYKGVLKDGRLVAVKRASTGWRRMTENSPFENELEILSKIHCSHVVNLIGFSHDCKETLLVVEFMANGTLHDLLHCRPQPLSWAMRVHLSYQTAKAILVLHTGVPPVIHRDIKSSNILIDENWNAKLGDFGLALRGHIEDMILLSTPPAGTMGYLDPGYVSPEHLSTKTDVFSFGILLLEIISGRNAIDVQYHPPSIVDWAVPLIKQGRALSICDSRAKLPADIDALKDMAVLAAHCVRLSTSKRPSMADVVQGLRGISKRIPFSRRIGRSGNPHRNSKLRVSPLEVCTTMATEVLEAGARR